MGRPLTEQQFQDEDLGHLVDKHGYAHISDRGGNAPFDRSSGLIAGELLAFVRHSQPSLLEAVTEDALIEAWQHALEDLGSVSVLHQGFEVYGHHVQVMGRRPKDEGTADTRRLYDANRLLVIDELHYDPNNKNRLDLAVFLNGFPIFTVELKNQFTGQGARCALDQYRCDRNPDAPLFRYPYRSLVHFAVDKEHAWMTTRLRGGGTTFLPFNRGSTDGGQGNPPIPGNHPTAYLWQQIWSRDTLLDIVERFVAHEPPRLTEEQDERWTARQKLESGTVIFPRFHQHECVTLLERRTITDAPSKRRYLVMHSTGSGKSLSMAWLAQRLTNLNHGGRKVFGTVIVVTDRVVLDEQMQALVPAIVDAGAAQPIAKVRDLERALLDKRSVVITTIHKFFHLLKSEGTLAKLANDVAVIIDEAHSSQGGALQHSLEEVLKRSEAGRIHIAYYAFTATPNDRAIDLFSAEPAGEKGPVHTYGMRQAREEGFIVDVLQNMVAYVQAAQVEVEGEDREVPNTTRIPMLVGDTTELIYRKARVVVDHFHHEVADLLGGQAKAMVLANSILGAVRYKEALKAELDARGFDYPIYIAFSGRDPVDGKTEAAHNDLEHVNADDDLMVSRRIATAFGDDGRILVVVNKFQTGFDEPRLAAMYVDKPLSGRTAVQTLSRLNRPFGDLKGPAASTLPRVVDFVNDPEDILTAFRAYDDGARQHRALTPGYIEALADALTPWITDDRATQLDGLRQDYDLGAHDSGPLSDFVKVIADEYRRLGEQDRAAKRAQAGAFVRDWPVASIALREAYPRGVQHTSAHWRRHRLCRLVGAWLENSSSPDDSEAPEPVTTDDLQVIEAELLKREDGDGPVGGDEGGQPGGNGEGPPKPYEVPTGKVDVVHVTLQALVDRYNAQFAAWIDGDHPGIDTTALLALLKRTHDTLCGDELLRQSALHNNKSVFARQFYVPEFRDRLAEFDVAEEEQEAVDWLHDHADVSALRPAANAAHAEFLKKSA